MNVGSPTAKKRRKKNMNIIFNTKLKKHHLPEKALCVRIDRCARTSGLLAFLSAEDLQTLVALLTFADESGRCELSSRTLGQAINLSEKQAQRRLKNLCEVLWHGKPLLMRENEREMGRFAATGYQLPEVEGLKIIANSPLQVGKRDGDGPGHRGSAGGSGVPEAHAPPVPVAEADIRKRLSASGTGVPDMEGIPPANTRITGSSCVGDNNINNNTDKEYTTEGGSSDTDANRRKRIFRELLCHGLSGSIASELLDRYPRQRIADQIEMLPFRNAREPAAMLIKAIKEDWTAPAAYMGRQRRKAEQKARAERESAEAERRRVWQKRVESAKAKLSHEELQRITRTAREKTQEQLGNAFHGEVPERLVKIEVNRIISNEHLNT